MIEIVSGHCGHKICDGAKRKESNVRSDGRARKSREGVVDLLMTGVIYGKRGAVKTKCQDRDVGNDE